ncbi:MAG: hypothetical protein ACRC1U_11080 [Vibrionaceae bacterium]
MRFIFTLLLLVFSIISAYITYLYTSSLSTSSSTLLAMAAMGLAFDALKSFLPAATLECFEQRRFIYASVCAIVCALLIAFSLYASFHLVDSAVGEKSKGSLAYELKQREIAALEQQREILFKHDKATLSAPVSAKIAVLQQELLAMPAPKTAGKSADFIASVVLSLLLELSVIACHFARRISTKNSSSKQAQKSAQKSASSQRAQGASASSKSSEKSAKGAFNLLQTDELAQVILNRGDANLTYRQLENKYSVSSNKVREVKQHLLELEQQNNAPLALVQ